MDTELVTLKNGLVIEMTLLKVATVAAVKIFFAQDRLCITDWYNNEIRSHDLIDLYIDLIV